MNQSITILIVEYLNLDLEPLTIIQQSGGSLVRIGDKEIIKPKKK